MIAGVAQIVLNVADLDAVVEEHLAAGYTESFRVDDIPNDASKDGFHSVPRERLDMSHLARPNELAVELTRYAGEPPGGRAPFRVLRAADGGVAEVEVPTARIDDSRRFWIDGLRFRPTSGDENVLEFLGPAPALNLRVVLRQEDVAAPATLDADGCVLVTMLATRLAEDLEALGRLGLLVRSPAPWKEAIGDRSVEITVLEGPGGELIELLQAPRRS